MKSNVGTWRATFLLWMYFIFNAETQRHGVFILLRFIEFTEVFLFVSVKL